MSDEITVRRNGWLTGAIAVVAAGLAAAFAVRGDGALDYVFAVCLAVLACVWGWVAFDARKPLMVLDARGARVRERSHWRGLVWGDLVEIEHLPSGWFRDGHLRLEGRDHTVHTVRLTMATKLYGAEEELAEQIADLAGGRTTVVLVDPHRFEEESAAQPIWVDHDGPEPTVEIDRRGPDSAVGTVLPTSTPESIRDRWKASQAGNTTDPRAVTMRLYAAPVDGATALQMDPALELDSEVQMHTDLLPEADLLTRPETPFDLDQSEADQDADQDIASAPAPDPVIGPYVVAARQRAGLSIEQLAARTGLRADVVAAIEVDDFAPCGGDFFARGHLRTIARVLGIEAAGLVDSYDRLYADSILDPRPAFRSELASAPKAPTGPNWSILVAAVMAIVLAWSVVRLVVDSSTPDLPAAPSLSDGSGGERDPYATSNAPVPVTVTAAGGGARVVIRNGEGKVIFAGPLAFGQSQRLTIAPPVRIQSSDGSVTVAIDGADPVAMGKTGEPTQRLFTVEG